MLSKEKRLNIKRDFSWVRSGQRLENSQLKLFYRFGEIDNPRVGIAVSGKVFKKAVERNRARRLLSSGFENLYNRLVKKVNILAMPKEEVLKLKSDEMVRILEELLKQGRLI